VKRGPGRPRHPGEQAAPAADPAAAGAAPADRNCLAQAVRWLAVRDHLTGELARKLRAKGYPGFEVDRALEQLAVRGYLDDVRVVRGFLAARLHRGVGRARLQHELARRGASPEAIAQAWSELEEGPSEELARARTAAAAWRPRGRAGRDPRLRRAALARHLAQRGFAADVVRQVVSSTAGLEPADDHEGAPSMPEDEAED
jgi:regulatory protein